MAEKDIPVIYIRPTNRFITAVGTLLDITDDDALLARAHIIDMGEVKPGETSMTAAERKRAKYCYEQQHTSALD